MATRSKEKSKKREANKDTRPKASARFIRISPTKVRVVLDIVRNKPVNEALVILQNTPKAASEVVYKLIASAAANAEFKNLDRDDLYVAEIKADGGPILKRVMPRAQGRAFRINKRTSHISVKLDTREAK